MSENDSVLDKIPKGIGREIGLHKSIPAVRVWGVISFERAFSGNEAATINEAFTDVETFLVEKEKDGNKEYELDARARVRATKFNYVRENFFRQCIRRVMEPYLEALSSGKNTEAYDRIINNAGNILPTDKHRSQFKSLVLKMATCAPYDPCGACPACIAEGAAASTAPTEGSFPLNWEKKYKETDFKTFYTIKSAAMDLGIPFAGQILQPKLTETVIRNRVPRPGTAETETGTLKERGMMFFKEHMFKGPGYFKTTVFNPTRLELGFLAYEHLVEDVRKGAKTSSGAGVWQIYKNGNGEPLIVVDEILHIEGFLADPPPPSMPTEVRDLETGLKKCFYDIIGKDMKDQISEVRDYRNDKNRLVMKRYIGNEAVKRLKTYFRELRIFNVESQDEYLEAFKGLVEYAAEVMRYIHRPAAARERVKQAEKEKEKKGKGK